MLPVLVLLASFQYRFFSSNVFGRIDRASTFPLLWLLPSLVFIGWTRRRSTTTMTQTKIIVVIFVNIIIIIFVAVILPSLGSVQLLV